MKKLKIIKSKDKTIHHGFIDDEDYVDVNRYIWYLEESKYTSYARATVNGKTVRLHRYLLKIDNPKILIDHIDRNGLNNQRNNLRECNPSENQKNKKASGKSKYLGVAISNHKYFSKKKNKIIIISRILAHIKYNGKYLHLGMFKDEISAAAAYNEAAIKYHGEFANLNKI